MLTAHLYLVRGLQSAWLKFSSFLYEAILFTPLHPELLNYKLRCRPWGLAQDLYELERESIAMTQARLRKHSLLTRMAGEDLLPWTWEEQALFCHRLEAFLLLLSLMGFASNVQHPPASGAYFFCLSAGSGMLSPGCRALRRPTTMPLLLIFLFYREN